jgi:ADP-heptose:LPS heptosyltransferase
MRTLLRFSGGIGDNVLASAIIKQYKQDTGDFIGWLSRDRCRRCGLHAHNPYIDRLHFPSAGSVSNKKWLGTAKKTIAEIVSHGQYDAAQNITRDELTRRSHKLYMMAACLNTTLRDPTTEFYYDKSALAEYYEKIHLPEEFVFFNGKSNLEAKDLPLRAVKRSLKRNGIRLPVVSPDFSWDIEDVPIAFAADVMLKAKYVFVTDSAMYHIANALKKKVDVAYFALGRSTWSHVRPLHTVPEQRVIFDLAELRDIEL